MRSASRRALIAAAALLLARSAAVAAEDDAAWDALRAGGIALFRHADAPGVGDPPGFRLGDCSTQRNLDARGREQAKRLGERLKQQRFRVGAVWTSQWCRTRETARLLDIGQVRDEPAFNSFFADRAGEPEQTARARSLLLGWRGPGALVVVTHQVNITALTGLGAASGDGIVLVLRDGALVVVGRIAA